MISSLASILHFFTYLDIIFEASGEIQSDFNSSISCFNTSFNQVVFWGNLLGFGVLFTDDLILNIIEPFVNANYMYFVIVLKSKFA